MTDTTAPARSAGATRPELDGFRVLFGTLRTMVGLGLSYLGLFFMMEVDHCFQDEAAWFCRREGDVMFVTLLNFVVQVVVVVGGLAISRRLVQRHRPWWAVVGCELVAGAASVGAFLGCLAVIDAGLPA